MRRVVGLGFRVQGLGLGVSPYVEVVDALLVYAVPLELEHLVAHCVVVDVAPH